MIESKSSSDDFKSTYQDKNKFVPNHLKTKKICKNAVKKLTFVIIYDPDQYKTQEKCDNAILENGGMLRLIIANCYKNQKMPVKVLIITPMY